MSGFITQFETQTPLKFKEKGCDLVFRVQIKGALYINELAEGAFGNTRNEQIETLRSMAVTKVEECLAHWHEGDKILYFDGRDALGDSLTAFLREDGISGSARIDDIGFTDAEKALYHERIITPLNEKKTEEFNQKLEAAAEPHGSLRSISYNLSSNGMMAGTSTSSHMEIDWKEDGSIIYRDTYSGGGRYVEREYRVKPEIAHRIIEFAEERKLAALSKLDIERPVMYDNFTSSTIVVTYDDRSVGGEYHNSYCINCGPARMAFKSLEDELSELLKNCEESGECIKNEMRENPNPFTAFMGMKEMMNMIDMGGQPGVPKQKWKCKCGNENEGKFCCECGSPKLKQ